MLSRNSNPNIDLKQTNFRERKINNRNKTIKRLCDREIEIRKALNKTELDEDEIVGFLKSTNPYNTLSPEIRKLVDNLEESYPNIYYRVFPGRKMIRTYQEKLRQIFYFID